MSWAEVKHAINSTLGTSKFKPLDQLLDSKIILQPSDEIYRLLRYAKDGVSFPAGGYVASATFNYGGCVKVFAKLSSGAVLIEIVPKIGASRYASISYGDAEPSRLCIIDQGDEIRIAARTGGTNVKEVYIGAVESNSGVLDASSIISDDFEV